MEEGGEKWRRGSGRGRLVRYSGECMGGAPTRITWQSRIKGSHRAGRH